MITRDEISIAITSGYGLGLTLKTDILFNLFQSGHGRHQELVGAVIMWDNSESDDNREYLKQCIKPFLPLLSEKLDKLDKLADDAFKYKSLLFRIGADIAKTECTCVEKSLYSCPRCKLVEKFAAIRREMK